MSYIPNLNDPRTFARMKQAYGFVNGAFSSSKARQWHTRTINEHFGRNDTDIGKFNRKYLLTCTKDNWSMNHGVCKEYILNIIGMHYIGYMLMNKKYLSYNDYVDMSEIVLEHAGNSSSDASENTSSIISDIATAKYPIVHDLQDDYKKTAVLDTNTSKYKKELTSLKFNYIEKSHRLFHGIQNINSDYRKELLANHGLKFNYDIECCAPTLLMQCSRRGLSVVDNIQYPAIEFYLEHRAMIRKDLANRLNVPIENIKKIINSLFNGAKLIASNFYESFKLLGSDKVKMQTLQNEPFIIELCKDISLMWNTLAIKRFMPSSNNKDGSISKKSLKAGKWDLYYRLERSVLETVIRYLSETDNKCFLEHDGWVTMSEIDVEDLQRYVSTYAGYSIKISAK